MEMLCRMMDSLSEVGRARGACDSMALAYILLHRSSGLLACSRFKKFRPLQEPELYPSRNLCNEKNHRDLMINGVEDPEVVERFPYLIEINWRRGDYIDFHYRAEIALKIRFSQ